MNRVSKRVVSILCGVFLAFSLFSTAYAKSPVVLMTDFGLDDGAVSAIRGVIYTVNPTVVVADLTHNIEPYNIREASYRLYQVMQYYPKGTVFVSVIDPGVGTERKSVVAKTKNGYYVVTPDNGVLTYVGNHYGFAEIREINEVSNRLPQSLNSHTFHGRDVYGYTGARLAAGVIRYSQVGKSLPADGYVKLDVKMPSMDQNTAVGEIVTLDWRWGNLWTNMDESFLAKANIKPGDMIDVRILNGKKEVFRGKMLFARTFGEVKVGVPLAYMNSLANLAVALNQGNFAKKYDVKPGFEIRISTVSE